MVFCVYQLKLAQKKHYFGTTPVWRKQKRLDEHYEGVASKWTRRFPPVAENPMVACWYFGTRKIAYDFEDVKCCEFLNKHGIDSTRGGLQNADLGVPYKYWVRKHLRHLLPPINTNVP